MAPADDEPELPERIGERYRVLAELASGGMGTVYLAEATGPGGFARLFALKRIHAHLAHEKSFVDMFLDEARITSRCRHPNVCAVHEVGFDGKAPFLAMDYLEGETISSILKKLWATPSERASAMYPLLMARIVADCCEGLHAAHELEDDRGQPLGVVHRDVTPQNLLVGYDGAARVLDFGVAKAAGRLHSTRSGAIKGKFAYMSPEQIMHKGLDRRSDIWSMGVTFWEALSLGRLFRRENEGATLHAILSDEIPDPGRPELPIPDELVRIVRKALVRDPDQRYATAREMATDLNRFLATVGEPIGIAETAAFMDRLFAKEKKQRRLFLEEARLGKCPTLLDMPQVVLTPGSKDEPSVSTVNLLGESRAASEARTEAEAEPNAWAASEVDTESVSLPTRRAPTKVLVGALLAGALLGGLGFALRSSDRVTAPDQAYAPEATPGANMPAEAAAPPAGMAAMAPTAPPPEVEVSAPIVEVPDPARPTRPREHHPRRDRAAASTMDTGSMTRPVGMDDAPPERVEASMVAAPQPPGRITVATPGGWADVTLDGRPAGRSPTVLSVSPGSHRIGLRPFGRAPASTHRVQLESGGRARVVVPLSAE
ncbi:MAG: protein kinase [Deltaproteobacteria bacterium]|nr:protein kinase [Deltaproteobacteria bacterium]